MLVKGVSCTFTSIKCCIRLTLRSMSSWACLANSLASRCIAARFIVCGCDADMLNGVTSSASEDGAWTTRVWSSSVLLPCSSLKAEVMSSVRSSRLICPPT